MSKELVSIFDHFDKIAVFSGGIFAGTALYMSIGEVPALRELGLDEQWRFFPLMYQRAAISQSVLALTTGIVSIAHATRIIGSKFDRNLWIGTGALFLSVFPYTFICMMPTNKFIIKANKAGESGSSNRVDNTTKRDLLDKWALLHTVRSIGSVVGFGIMVFGLSRHASLTLKW